MVVEHAGDRAGRGGVSCWLAVLAIGLHLSVSANLLTWIGVPYVSDGGSILWKLHPATDLLLLAFPLLLCRHGCRRGAWTVVVADPLLLSFLAFIAASIVYLLALTGAGNLVVMLDTFLPAGLVAVIMRQASGRQLAALRRLFQFMLVINALLALGEMAAHATLVPLYLNNAEYHPHAEDFRPTALFDHPLTGAVMTMLALSLAPEGGRWRLAYRALMWLALFTYGGRMAMLATGGITLAGAVARNWALLLRRDPAASRVIATSVLVLVLAVLLAGVALSAGLGARLAGHLYWDSSAQVRLAQWQVLDHLDAGQLLFGTRREDLLALLTPLWLGPGVEVIENFWLLMFINFGALGFPLFLAALVALLAWCWRRTGMQGRLLVGAVMLVASTSNSLGRKSSILVCLVAAIICLSKKSGEISMMRARTLRIPTLHGAMVPA